MLHEIFKGMDNASEAINENFNFGSIVDEGEDINGSYVKYGNGWMVCRKKAVGGEQTTTNSVSSGVHANDGVYWQFPQPFSEAPIVDINVRRTGGYVWPGASGDVNTTGATFVRLMGSSSAAKGYLDLEAIGRYE